MCLCVCVEGECRIWDQSQFWNREPYGLCSDPLWYIYNAGKFFDLTRLLVSSEGGTKEISTGNSGASVSQDPTGLPICSPFCIYKSGFQTYRPEVQVWTLGAEGSLDIIWTQGGHLATTKPLCFLC